MARCARAEEKTAVPEPIAYIAIGIIIGAVATVRGLLHWERNKREPRSSPQLKPRD